MSKKARNRNLLIKFYNRLNTFIDHQTSKHGDDWWRYIGHYRDQFLKMHHIDRSVANAIYFTVDVFVDKKEGILDYELCSYLRPSGVVLSDNQIAFLVTVNVSDNKLKRKAVEWAWANRHDLQKFKQLRIVNDLDLYKGIML